MLQSARRYSQGIPTMCLTFDKLVTSRRNLYKCDLDATEELAAYCAGGYHPVHLGDRFKQGQYQILHKLGFGGFSTVWLARDHRFQQNVALKILMSRVRPAEYETRTLRALANSQKEASGTKHIVKLLDEFQHSGPNGLHTCLVMELLGPNIAQAAAQFDHHRLPQSLAKSVAKQALCGLHFMHSNSVAHGDIHTGNIVFTDPELRQMSGDDAVRYFGTPEIYEVSRSDGAASPGAEVPKYLINTVQYPQVTRFSHQEVKLIDFGNCFATGKMNEGSLRTPMGMRAPELALRAGFDHRSDLWSMGCMIAEIFTGWPLFQSLLTTEMVLIGDMLERLRTPLPERWRHLYRPAPAHLPGYPRDEDDPGYLALHDYLMCMYSSDHDGQPCEIPSPAEIARLEAAIRKLVRFEPEKRVSADRMALDPLFQS